MQHFDVKGGAHITGGGLVENVPRMLPDGCQVELDPDSWPVPELFRHLGKAGQLTDEDLFRTFNMGIGMTLYLPPEQSEAAVELAEEMGEKAYLIGRVAEGKGDLVWRRMGS